MFNTGSVPNRPLDVFKLELMTGPLNHIHKQFILIPRRRAIQIVVTSLESHRVNGHTSYVVLSDNGKKLHVYEGGGCSCVSNSEYSEMVLR